MKKNLLKMIALGLTMTTTCLFAGCSSSSSAGGTSTPAPKVTAAAAEAGQSVKGALKGVKLKIGTSGLFGPFSYYDTDGKTLIGYDIDLINVLKDYLGFEVDGSITAMDYSALTTSIAEKKLDMGAAALCVTDERKKVMDFSNTYCDSGQVVMVNSKDDKGIASVNDLKGKTVAVEKGTASHTYATKNLSDSTLQVNDTITTAYESLEQGKVDAVIQDGPGAAFYIKTTDSTNLKVVGDEFNQGQAPYAIAFKQGFEYTDTFNKALSELAADGTLDTIYKKWCA